MIARSTLDFLKKLKKNNNKDWFDANRDAYELAKTNMQDVVKQLIDQLSVFDSTIKGLEPKHCMFRINRDVRFSKNKAPYKTNLGAIMNKGGKKSNVPGYYIHIEPGNSFVAGGSWMPEAPELAAIRQEIDYNTKEFQKIISAKEFKSLFGSLSEEDKLKTAPKGYEKDHPAIELLKHKSFIVVHELKDTQLLDKNFIKNTAKVFKAMYPLDCFLRKALD